MKEQIIQLLQQWKREISDIPLEVIYLFGSSIYSNGRMFKPGVSDLDLVILMPDNLTEAIERKNWLVKLKIHKQELEKRALFLFEKKATNEQIVSIVPITKYELNFDIHKGETRNFFSINEFLDVDSTKIFKGSDVFNFEICQNEFVIQVLKSIQKVRNSFLTNSAMFDHQELEWKGEDIIPKTLAREAAKIASLLEDNNETGDEMNTSFGCDFLKQNLKLLRSYNEFLNLYTWIDDRNGGRSNSSEKELLAQENHLLLYELLYDLTVSAYSSIKSKEDNPNKNPIIMNKSEKYKKFLDDAEMLSKAHSSKEGIKLSDIFISPIFKKYDDSKDEIRDVNFTELQESFDEHSNIVLIGEGQSGKTTLCKQLILNLSTKGYIPIYLADGKNQYLGNINNKIEDAFKEQYESDCNFADIDISKVLIIIDDFHYSKNKERILEQIKHFKNKIIVVDEIFGFNFKNETIIDSYQKYKINEFSPSQRYELIKNWVLLSNNNLKTDNEIYLEIDNKTELVDSALGKIIGKGIMPSYPFFILSFISNYDTVSKPLDQNITTQGYFYQSLIYIYLRKEGVKNEDFDAYFNFLTELAHFTFKKGKNLISNIEFDLYLSKYKSEFNLTVKIEELLINLRNTNIISLDSLGNYYFTYSYIYYFFAAKYFAENTQKEIKTIERILGNLHKDEFAYIAIFISHHDKNTVILDEIILNAMTLFEKHAPATLSIEELSFFDERIDEVVQAALPMASDSAEKHRIEELKRKDEIEQANSVEEISDDDQESEDNELAVELRRSIRTVEVMGRIIKNRAGSLKNEQLEVIFREGMNVHLRILTSFIEIIKNEESQNLVEDYIARRLLQIINSKDSEQERKRFLDNEDRMKKIARNIFWNTNFNIIYNLTSKIIHSLGSNKLTDVIQSVCDKENTPVSFIIKHGIFMWYNKSLQIDEIYDRIEADGFSKTSKRIMENRIVNHCQTHSMGFKEHQHIESRSKIPQRVLLKRK